MSGTMTAKGVLKSKLNRRMVLYTFAFSHIEITELQRLRKKSQFVSTTTAAAATIKT